MTAIPTDIALTDDSVPGDPDAAAVRRISLGLALFLVGWAGSVALWGIPGLYVPALALVPVMWVVLLVISRG